MAFIKLAFVETVVYEGQQAVMGNAYCNHVKVAKDIIYHASSVFWCRSSHSCFKIWAKSFNVIHAKYYNFNAQNKSSGLIFYH